MDRFLGMTVFARAVELGSFSAAGEALGLSQSAISQRIKLLEARVGQPVLVRGTPPTPTEIGRRLLNHVQQVRLLERDLQSQVPALDEEFDVAIIGTKGKWYDHTVSVRNAEPKTEQAAETPADGAYTAAVVLEGGSGRATVESPAALTVADGRMTATIVWSSPNYDYMLVDGEKYLPTNTEGNSTFEIPVTALDTPLDVVGDTVAMSTPHEIEYTLTFASASLIEAK